MRPLNAADLLTAWERALPLPPPLRPLAVLAAAWPGEEPAGLSVGASNARLLALRERLFAPRLEALADCPACGERLELSFTAADLLAAAEAPGELSGRYGSYELRFRVPSAGDLAALAAETEAEAARLALFRRCLLE